MLFYQHAHVTRKQEACSDSPVLGANQGIRGFIPGRCTLELNVAGEGWRVDASVANSPLEEKASAEKLISALTTAIALVEARIKQEGA